MRVVFMGTPDFSVPTLAEIIGAGHDVVAVYSRAFASGLFITQVTAEAHIAPSTWARLRAGAVPRKSTIDKLNRAIDALIAADQEGADGAPSRK